MRVPERIHFFSYTTGVSIELPIGFTPGGDGVDGASYTRYDDDDQHVQAAVLISVLAGPESGGESGGEPGGASGAAAALVQGMSSVAGQVLDTAEHEIDEENVVTAVLRFPQGLPSGGVAAAEPEVVALLGSDLLVTFAAVEFGGRLVTVTAAAPFELAAQYRTEFAEALASCRFIAAVPT